MSSTKFDCCFDCLNSLCPLCATIVANCCCDSELATPEHIYLAGMYSAKDLMDIINEFHEKTMDQIAPIILDKKSDEKKSD